MHKIEFNKACTNCKLSSGRAIPGQSLESFEDVKLIIIKDCPNKSEEYNNYAFVDQKRRFDFQSLTKEMSHGEFMRMSLHYQFDKDKDIPSNYKPFEDFVYFTYSVKCNRKDKTIEDVHRRKCKETWLFKELSHLPKDVPILVCGNHPVKSLLGKGEGVWDNRGKELYYQNHPLVVTMDPEDAEHGKVNLLKHPEEVVKENIESYLEHNAKIHPKDVDTLIEVDLWRPVLMGQSMWYWNQDMKRIKELVKKYMGI